MLTSTVKGVEWNKETRVATMPHFQYTVRQKQLVTALPMQTIIEDSEKRQGYGNNAIPVVFNEPLN